MSFTHWIAIGLCCLGFSNPIAHAASPDQPTGISLGKQAYDNRDYAGAMKAWRPLAEAGDPLAQFHLGNIFVYGKGVKRNMSEGKGWWQKAIATWRKQAEAGNADAQYRLAQMYENGRSVKRDIEKARHWYRLSADQSHARSQYHLGRRLIYAKKKDPKDHADGFRWLERASAQGLIEAIYHLAVTKGHGTHPDGRDPKGAFKLFLKSATAGDKGSQYKVALYYEGHWPKIVQRNYKTAREWLLKATNQRHFKWPALRLAIYYMHGLGVKRDRVIARNWAGKSKSFMQGNRLYNTLKNSDISDDVAAEQACAVAAFFQNDKYHFLCNPELSFHASVSDVSKIDIPARIALGHTMYESRNLPIALGAWQSIAETGHAEAQYLVGSFYRHSPQGRDLIKARSWFLKSAKQGHPTAQFKVGLMILKGTGRQKRDRDGGMRWINKALDQDSPEALEYFTMSPRILKASKIERFKIVERAANAGSIIAQTMAADHYENGPLIPPKYRKGPPNYAKSLRWLVKAAEGTKLNSRGQRQITSNFLLITMNAKQRIDARLRLAVYYIQGLSVKPNRATARSWVRKAVEENNSDLMKMFPFHPWTERLNPRTKKPSSRFKDSMSKITFLLSEFDKPNQSDEDLVWRTCSLVKRAPVCRKMRRSRKYNLK